MIKPVGGPPTWLFVESQIRLSGDHFGQFLKHSHASR